MKSNSEDTNRKFITREELAIEFVLDTKTLRKLIKESGIELPKGLLSPAKVREIRNKFGLDFNTEKSSED